MPATTDVCFACNKFRFLVCDNWLWFGINHQGCLPDGLKTVYSHSILCLPCEQLVCNHVPNNVHTYRIYCIFCSESFST